MEHKPRSCDLTYWQEKKASNPALLCVCGPVSCVPACLGMLGVQSVMSVVTELMWAELLLEASTALGSSSAMLGTNWDIFTYGALGVNCVREIHARVDPTIYQSYQQIYGDGLMNICCL